MRRYVLVLLLFVCVQSYAQNTVNNYKFVVVPERFSFLKENDQYSLNSYTKGFLQDKGFTAYFDNTELPTDVANNKCNALTADLLEKSGMFSTSLTLVLKDCRGNIIFKSKEGKSREKDYKTAYYLALKDAFASLDKLSYVSPSTGEQAQPVVATTAPALNPEKQTAIPAASAEPVKTTTVASAEPVKAAVAAPAAVVRTTAPVASAPAGTLYAQAIANGYQLIDTTPKIVLTLLKTSAENYFIAGNGTDNGIVLKKNENWFFEYYKDGKLISEKLSVKF